MSGAIPLFPPTCVYVMYMDKSTFFSHMTPEISKPTSLSPEVRQEMGVLRGRD